ncbi:hypothetical protein ACRYCC_28135 [Actinomadura scrupuli]|uniref:hypothetical protein n=1 Tax=Actinomadura scrupuli TaxID=559629 RepID=UPI003D97692B
MNKIANYGALDLHGVEAMDGSVRFYVSVVTDRHVLTRIKDVLDRLDIRYEGGWMEEDHSVRWVHAIVWDPDISFVFDVVHNLLEVWEPGYFNIDYPSDSHPGECTVLLL